MAGSINLLSAAQPQAHKSQNQVPTNQNSILDVAPQTLLQKTKLYKNWLFLTEWGHKSGTKTVGLQGASPVLAVLAEAAAAAAPLLEVAVVVVGGGAAAVVVLA